ncbi:MAG: YeeE/YedE thiosulfate transporter family protein, partial [Deferribacterota bacterium]|nr:YeeE/YedE thiosulfate transporter family protein [Deferribacterota bacterium]
MATAVQVIDEAKDLAQQKNANLNKPQTSLIISGLLVCTILLIYLIVTQVTSQTLLFVIGLLLGYTLFHARFGFASAFCRFTSVGNGQELRSHMLMLSIAVTLFAPILSFGYSFFGGGVSGHVAPVGISLLVGAFMFGIGMQ